MISRHGEVNESVSRLRAFGIDRNVVEDRKIPGMYDVQGIGLNYRLNEIGAAMGIEQMRKLPGFLEKRRENDTVVLTLDREGREVDAKVTLGAPR